MKQQTKKNAQAKKPEQKKSSCKCQGKKNHKVAEIRVGTSVPNGMEPIFTSFMQNVMTVVGEEVAVLLSVFDGALREACKSAKKSTAKKEAK